MKTFWTLVAIVCTAPFLILAWMWVDEWLADRQDKRRQTPAPRQPRLASEWSHVKAGVAQARADIAAEAEHFDMWEQEVSA